jgi:hypothetical protein
MKPVYWIIAVLLGAGVVGAWQYSQQSGAAPSRPDVSNAVRPAPSSWSVPDDAEPVAVEQPDPAPGVPLSQWVTDSESTDAAKRSTAITALATTPREQALPALERLVLNAEPADRQLALASLQRLALEQGDADHGIRSVIREVIYHGDDEQLAAGAQLALDAVESASVPQR